MDPLYGIYRGRCYDNADPEKRGRIKVQVPQLFGDQVLEDWAWPCRPPGWDQNLLQSHSGGSHTQWTGSGEHSHTHTLVQPSPVPRQGVWVMFEAGDRDHPIYVGTF